MRFLVYCFIILFQIKSVKPFVAGQNHDKYLHFYVFKETFVVLQPYRILGVFHYFGHHGRPASKVFNPRLSFEYLNPAIILIKKNCALGVLRNGFGQKQSRFVIAHYYHHHYHCHNHHCHSFSSPLWCRLCLRCFGWMTCNFLSSRLVTFQHILELQIRTLSYFLKNIWKILFGFITDQV